MYVCMYYKSQLVAIRCCSPAREPDFHVWLSGISLSCQAMLAQLRARHAPALVCMQLSRAGGTGLVVVVVVVLVLVRAFSLDAGNNNNNTCKTTHSLTPHSATCTFPYVSVSVSVPSGLCRLFPFPPPPPDCRSSKVWLASLPEGRYLVSILQ